MSNRSTEQIVYTLAIREPGETDTDVQVFHTKAQAEERARRYVTGRWAQMDSQESLGPYPVATYESRTGASVVVGTAKIEQPTWTGSADDRQANAVFREFCRSAGIIVGAMSDTTWEGTRMQMIRRVVDDVTERGRLPVTGAIKRESDDGEPSMLIGEITGMSDEADHAAGTVVFEDYTAVPVEQIQAIYV